MDEIVGEGFNVGGVGIMPLPNRKVKMKRIYYHPGTGKPTCPLPADPYHERLFLRMGFTLEPPQMGSAQSAPSEGPLTLQKGEGKCPVCGKKCKRVSVHYNLAHKES